MSNTLISFLGRAKLDPETGYRTTTYDFDGTEKTTPFFGMALRERLKPQKLLLIGTAGSMWDVFFIDQSEQHEQHILMLKEAVKQQRVDEEMLRPFIPELKKCLGCDVEFLIIDYARDEAAQVKLLLDIAAHLADNEHISIDVTHSFRHLPMLALVAARYLYTVKDITTDNIYYGALDMTKKDGITPVIRLEGLLKMLEWTDALASYDKDGDYYPFAELYQTEGLDEAATLLRKAAFSERTNQISNACDPLQQFRSLKADSIISSLFTPELRKRTAWVEKKHYADQQLQMAEHHLSKYDYLRTCLFAQEAMISYLVHQQYGENKNNKDYKIRRKIQIKLNKRIRKKESDEPNDELKPVGENENNKGYNTRKKNQEKQNKRIRKKDSDEPNDELNPVEQAYKNIRDIRNTLAHGTESNNHDIDETVRYEDKLLTALKKDLRTLGEAIRSGKTL